MTPPSLDELERGVLAGDRTLLARAITLVESTRLQDRDEAQELLARIAPKTGGSTRIAISGSPGVGKSTFIEAFGCMLCEAGRRVAVLAVDPASVRGLGSILGDKSRMQELAQHERAYIRPSPSAPTFRGVGRRTRESVLLCEAAGFDVVIVETVGVGQSETMVDDMVDFFLLLMQPGAGDELQGIKRGVLEIADAVVVNKADGELLPFARDAQQQYLAALKYRARKHDGWTPPALLASARERSGLDEVWKSIEAHRNAVDIARRRGDQLVQWWREEIEESIRERFWSKQAVQAETAGLERAVRENRIPPTQAARRLLDL
ncbi:MAG: methylmalonyl Co-A mutase-associated GTPase MeaB [Planctomycetota bacterium]